MTWAKQDEAKVMRVWEELWPSQPTTEAQRLVFVHQLSCCPPQAVIDAMVAIFSTQTKPFRPVLGEVREEAHGVLQSLRRPRLSAPPAASAATQEEASTLVKRCVEAWSVHDNGGTKVDELRRQAARKRVEERRRGLRQ